MKKLLLALFCLSTVSGFSFDGDGEKETEQVTEGEKENTTVSQS